MLLLLVLLLLVLLPIVLLSGVEAVGVISIVTFDAVGCVAVICPAAIGSSDVAFCWCCLVLLLLSVLLFPGGLVHSAGVPWKQVPLELLLLLTQLAVVGCITSPSEEVSVVSSHGAASQSSCYLPNCPVITLDIWLSSKLSCYHTESLTSSASPRALRPTSQ